MRTRPSGLACGLALLLAAPVGMPGAEVIDPEIRQALRAAKTVRLEVVQEYDFTEEKAEDMNEETKGDEAKSGGATPEGDKPVKKFSLPLAELAQEAIKLTGWKLAGPDEAADVTMTVEVRGTPLGAQYIGALAGYHYTGAELQGSVRLVVGGQIVVEEEINAEIPVAPTIHSYSYNYHTSPRDAPFPQTLPEYCEAVFTVLGRACGPGPVVAGLKLENPDQQTGAGRALLEVGDASIEPALTELLGQDKDRVAQVAALGLGVLGRASALPPLLAALRKDKSNARLASLRDPSDDELLSSLSEDPGGVLRSQERAAAARGLLEAHGALHRLVEWALLQIEAPDKFSQLTAALRNPESVMLRRGAAVVLGGMADQRAFEPLAAATRDKEPLVRAAALAALGRLNDERSVEVFLARADDATGYVAKLARQPLVEAGKKRWEKFLEPRLKVRSAPGGIPERALLDGFAHSDPLVRATAARLSSYRAEPEIKAGLAALLQSDPRAFVREAVVESLAESGEDRNAPLLALALGDTDAATRRRAVAGLAEYSAGEDDPAAKAARSRLPEAALGPLLVLVARDELGAERAAALLERIEGPGVADKLLQALQMNRSPVLLRLLAHRLAEMGDKRARPQLLALLEKATEPAASQFVADALVMLGDPAALEPLFAQLKSGTPTARRLAMNVLGRLQQPQAIGPLIAALRAGENARMGEPAEGQTGAAREALETLTGKNFSTGNEWLNWWKENSGKPFVLPVSPSKEG